MIFERSGFEQTGQNTSGQGFVFVNHLDKAVVMHELGRISCEEVCDGNLQGCVGQMDRLWAAELLHALNEKFGSPMKLETQDELRDDLFAKAWNVVLVGNDEDIHMEEQRVWTLGEGTTFAVGQVVDVADHGMDSFRVIVVSEVNFWAGRNLLSS